MSAPQTNQRKRDHIDIVLNKPVDDQTHVFDRYTLPYRALPETNFSDVDTSCTFFDKDLSFPFIISSMTWGPVEGKKINTHLAEAAEEVGVALWLWSMRVIIEDPTTLDSFNIRALCPTIPLFANVWIIQFNYWFWADECNRLIDAIGADWLFLHVNPMQEIVQPEWDTNFAWLIEKLTTILPKLNAPVIVKETGNGIDWETAAALKSAWVQRIDVSWRWWISWPAVEGWRRDDTIGETIRWLGLYTDEALKQCRQVAWLNLIAGWWIRSWVDIAKAIRLWASIWTAGGPFLKPALDSTEAVIAELLKRKKEYQAALFSSGCNNTQEFIHRYWNIDWSLWASGL